MLPGMRSGKIVRHAGASPGGDAVTLVTGSAPISDGTLATFDPTLLLNGLYELELTATDVQGQQVSDQVAVSVEGQMKSGHFTLAFVDLDLPVSGLDLEVVRHYDSRDKRMGDFGVGWTLEIRQGALRHNRIPGEGWQIVEGLLPCEVGLETASHVTVITLSDLEVYRFTPEPVGLRITEGGCFAEARYNLFDGPVAGATLEILSGNEVFYAHGSDELIDVDTLETFEPERVRLRTRNGRSFELSLAHGVERIEDHDGNSLVFQDDSIVHSSGKTLNIERDAAGRIVRITDPNDHQIVYTYDPRGDLVSVTDQVGSTTRFTYDEDHRILEIEDPVGNRAVRNDYDADGRLVRMTDALGKTIELTHDLGNRRQVIRNNDHTVEIEYDHLNRRTRIVYDDGSADEDVWDALGRLVARIDQNGRRTDFEYDCAGRLVRVEDALGQVTRYSWDEAGNLIAVTDAEGRGSRFTHDRRGRVTSHQLPLGQVKTIAYDAVGRPTAVTDFNGRQTAFTYDDADRMIGKSHLGAGTVAVTYTATGRRASVTTGEGTWSFAYDSRDRLTSVAHPGGRTVAYSYDPAGNRTAIATSTGSTLYRFDAANRPVELESEAGIHRFAYDPTGDRTSIEYADGTTAAFSYDSLDRLTEVTHRRDDGSVLASYAYTLDPEGNRLSVTEAGGRTVGYTYDGVYRLIGETVTDPVHGDRILAYTYDRVGNRLTRTVDGVATSYEYDANDRLLAAGDVSFDYDAIGNLIRRTRPEGVDTYEYDRENRLIWAQVDGRTVDLAYDDDGLRIRRTVDDTETTEFLYDANRPLARVLTELDAAGEPSAEYVHGSEVLSIDRGGDVHTFHADAQGTVRLLTGAGGAAAAEYGFDAFGVPLYETGSVANDYRYIGEPHDPDLGLSYLRARHYAPGTPPGGIPLVRALRRGPVGAAAFPWRATVDRADAGSLAVRSRRLRSLERRRALPGPGRGLGDHPPGILRYGALHLQLHAQGPEPARLHPAALRGALAR